MKHRTKHYQKDAELRDTVKYCMDLRLTEKETLEKLSSLGDNIDVRTLRRIKKKLPKPTRLDILIEKGESDLIIDAINDLKEAIKEAKEIAKKEKNPYLKL